jgi:Flp pilus assembly protein TadD
VARAPQKIRPRIQLARASETDRALELLGEAQRIAPDDPDVASEQGRVYMAAGMRAQALAAFGRALALSPSDALALNNRGVALFSLGQIDAARQDFERAIKVDPCLFDARLNLRKMGISIGNPPQCRYTPDQRQQLKGH